MRGDAEFVVGRPRLRRVVDRARLVLEVGEGPIEVRGGQVERAGINAHQALHQPLQRDEPFAEAGQALGPLVGAAETPAGDDVGMVILSFSSSGRAWKRATWR